MSDNFNSCKSNSYVLASFLFSPHIRVINLGNDVLTSPRPLFDGLCNNVLYIIKS
jgi:hypothetical protein